MPKQAAQIGFAEVTIEDEALAQALDVRAEFVDQRKALPETVAATEAAKKAALAEETLGAKLHMASVLETIEEREKELQQRISNDDPPVGARYRVGLHVYEVKVVEAIDEVVQHPEKRFKRPRRVEIEGASPLQPSEDDE